MPLLRDFTLKSIIKFISLKALVVFCILGTIHSQTIKLNDFPVDVSIFDGQGSLMIEWSYPDSILANQIRIFVQESGQSNFELLTELTPEHNNYLDLRCESNARYFYKIEVKDAFGTIFTSDFKTPAFGTCLTVEDSMAFDPTIRTSQDLVISQIYKQALDNGSNGDYRSIIDLLKLTKKLNIPGLKIIPSNTLKWQIILFKSLMISSRT